MHKNTQPQHNDKLPRFALSTTARTLCLLGTAGILSATTPLATAHTLTGLSRGTPTVLPSGMDPVVTNDKQADSLQLSMAAGATPGTVVFSLTNTSNAPISFLRDGTPFDDAPGRDVLRILPAGKQDMLASGAQYIGPVYRRLEPNATRFIDIAAGQTLTAEIDVSAYYDIDTDGDFRISYRGSIQVADTPFTLRARADMPDVADAWRPNTAALEMTLEARSPLAQTRSLDPVLNQCSTTQQNMLTQATVSGEVITNESIQSLNNTPVESRPTSPRYTTWFGVYTEPNYSFVTEVFNRASRVLAEERITYDCQPTLCSSENVVAYVQPFLSETVSLCPLFFDTNRLNDEFRAGTVVHELTHLLRIAGTQDFSYGSQATAALANTNPVQSLNNADSFTLFATNDRPTLPMIDDGTAPPVDDPPDGPSNITFVPLPGGMTATGSLGVGEVDAYRVTDSIGLELTSLTGDADLQVFSDPNLSRESLVCTSVNATPIDSCQINGQGEHFVVVYGFSATDYELVAAPLANPPGDNPGSDIADGAVEIGIGQVASQTLGQNEAVLLHAIMPARITLTSITGNSDLYVFRNSILTEENLVCRSELSSPQDICDLPGSGRVHIGVLGTATSNSFELTLTELEGTGTDTGGTTDGMPADDDPTGGSGGGGGAFGGAGLILLAGFSVAARRRSSRINFKRDKS